MAGSKFFSDLKNLAGKSAVYGLGSIFLKAIGFFLLPLYTRYLTPSDYGVIAVTAMVTTILGILYPLGLHGALARFYYRTQDPVERRRISSTLWVAIILVAAVMTVLLDRLGGFIFPLLFREVPFVPYIRLAVWTAFFVTIGLLPLVMMQVQERPALYVLLSIGTALLSIGLVIFLVVFKKQGAYGFLLGTLLANMVFAIPYILVMLPNLRFRPDWALLKPAFLYSLPLVPHGLASWVLELSDRAILEHFVSLNDLGLYSMGYQLASLINLLTAAFSNAWVPFLFKMISEDQEDANVRVARLVTYYTLVLCTAALGLALFIKFVLQIMTSPAFHSAAQVTPLVIGGYVFSGLYLIPVGFLFWKEQTRLIPVITVVSGLVNIALNLWLVPLFGIMASAWATLISYGLMLLLAWIIAQRVYPLPYEYKRVGQAVILALGLYILSSFVKLPSLQAEVSIRAAIFLAYPMILLALGFFTTSEKEAARSFARQLQLRLRQDRAG